MGKRVRAIRLQRLFQFIGCRRVLILAQQQQGEIEVNVGAGTIQVSGAPQLFARLCLPSRLEISQAEIVMQFSILRPLLNQLPSARKSSVQAASLQIAQQERMSNLKILWCKLSSLLKCLHRASEVALVECSLALMHKSLQLGRAGLRRRRERSATKQQQHRHKNPREIRRMM